jgi:hypothetical protein
LKGIEDFIDSIVKGIIDNDMEKKKIGSISQELCVKFKKMIKDKENLTNEIKVQVDVYEAEIKLKLLKEYGSRIDFYSELKDELWLEISKELNIPEEGNYSLNHTTGVVSEKIKKGDSSPTDDFIRKLKLAKRMP